MQGYGVCHVFLVIILILASVSAEKKKVVSILEDPYLMRTRDGGYEGYIKDLMDDLANQLGFEYEFHLVKDGRYGSPDENGDFNGIVGEVVRKEADIGAAALTITSMREKVVDFTKPYMSSGITMLMRRPRREAKTSSFVMFIPFSFDLWILIVILAAVSLFVLWMMRRFVPVPSSSGPSSKLAVCSQTCGQTLSAMIPCCYWATVKSRPLSYRIFLATWILFFFLALIFYLPALYRVLSVGEKEPYLPATNVEELTEQTEVDYGTVAGGSTFTFFKTSQVPTYQKMYTYMESRKPSVFVNSTREGMDRVKKGKYAFLGESTSIDYITSRNCELMRVGGNLNSVGYGLVTSKGSPLRDELSMGILRLSEQGRLEQLYDKWWQTRGICGKAPEVKKRPAETGLIYSQIGVMDFANFGAVWILIGGLILSCIVAIVECVKNRGDHEIEKDKMKEVA